MVNNLRMSTRRKLVETDVDTDKAPVGDDVRRWPNTAGSGSPCLDSVRRSSISFKPKEPTLSSSVVVVGRGMRTDDRLVLTTPKDGAMRAGRQQIGVQRGAMTDEEGAEEEEDKDPTVKRLWPFVKATLGARQMSAQRGAMMAEEEAGEEEHKNPMAKHLWISGKAMLGAQQIGAQLGPW